MPGVLSENSGGSNFATIPLDESAINKENRLMVINILSSTATSINNIQKSTNLPLPAIYIILLELELAGKITRSPGGGIVRVF